MALTLQEQIKQTFDKSNDVLITFSKNHNPDAVATSLGLKLLLEKMDKRADIVCDGFKLRPEYSFLPQATCISGSLEGVKQFKICLDLKKSALKDFSYAVENDTLNIYLTPKHGSFRPDDIKTDEGAFKYDLIITLDTEDLDSLGDVYLNHKDLFYNTNILNLDHRPENENYGQINHIDLNVTSNAELVYRLFEKLDPESKLTDKEVAQCLLCGVISKTKSFKSPLVTPNTLHVASSLMKRGADREMIVKNLYYTKSIDTLKLWGQVLSRLTSDPETKVAWSFLDQKDFDSLKSTPDNIPDIIDELILTAPEAKIILIVYQYGKQLQAVLYSDTSLSSKELAASYNPVGSSRLATFKVVGDQPEVAARLLVNDLKRKRVPLTK